MAKAPQHKKREDATNPRESAFKRMIERGLADSLAGRVISHEELGRRLALVKSGQAKTLSWDEVEQHIVQARRARKQR